MPRLRLLIADDHAPFVSSLEAFLAVDESLEVIGVARDGAEAVALAASLEPDVVLLDVNMPRLDGFEAAGLIRARNPRTRMIMVTGHAINGDAERARELGVVGFVHKADLESDLLPAIHTAPA